MKAVFWKDIRLAMGAGGGFGQGLAFFVMVLFLFALAMGADQQKLAETAPAMIFISILLSGLITHDRIFKADDDDGTLAILRLAPTPLSAIVIAKALAHYVTTGFAMTLLAPLAALMLGMKGEAIADLTLALLLGAPALSFLGTIGASLTLSVKRSSLIQAVVTMPLYIPTLIYGSIAASASERQNAALLLLFGTSLLVIVLAPWVSARIIERNPN